MSDGVLESLIVDLVRWTTESERSYEEAMNAWRTSCPQLPVWEDAHDRGLIVTEEIAGRSIVRATVAGLNLLHSKRK